MTAITQPELKSLCVFCGSSSGTEPSFRQAAGRLGALMAERGVALVYGGGHIGLMGALAEAVIEGGGRVIGVIPEHLMRMEVAYLEIHELIVVDSMHTRKRRMFDAADGFVVLPGGLGTMDEAFEILTWKQLRLHNKPIIVVNQNGYWDDWVRLVDKIVTQGFAHPEITRLFTVVDDIDRVIDAAREELSLSSGAESQLF